MDAEDTRGDSRSQAQLECNQLVRLQHRKSFRSGTVYEPCAEFFGVQFVWDQPRWSFSILALLVRTAATQSIRSRSLNNNNLIRLGPERMPYEHHRET